MRYSSANVVMLNIVGIVVNNLLFSLLAITVAVLG